MESVTKGRIETFEILSEFIGYLGHWQKTYPNMGPMIASMLEVSDSIRTETGLTQEEQVERLSKAKEAAQKLSAEIDESFKEDFWDVIQDHSHNASILGIMRLATEIERARQQLDECVKMELETRTKDALRGWLQQRVGAIQDVLEETRAYAETRDFEAITQARAEKQWAELAPELEEINRNKEND